MGSPGQPRSTNKRQRVIKIIERGLDVYAYWCAYTASYMRHEYQPRSVDW